ncbi:MAG: single-stranded DNA-binding protein [Actinomycetota bacterium]
MNEVNRIFFLGNLTRDPELKQTEEGSPFAELAIAVNKYWKDRDGKDMKSVDFISMTCWNSLAQNCANSLRKGNRIMAAGHVKFKSTEKDGKNYTRMFLVADAVAASLEFSDVIIPEGSSL